MKPRSRCQNLKKRLARQTWRFWSKSTVGPIPNGSERSQKPKEVVFFRFGALLIFFSWNQNITFRTDGTFLHKIFLPPSPHQGFLTNGKPRLQSKSVPIQPAVGTFLIADALRKPQPPPAAAPIFCNRVLKPRTTSAGLHPDTLGETGLNCVLIVTQAESLTVGKPGPPDRG